MRKELFRTQAGTHIVATEHQYDYDLKMHVAAVLVYWHGTMCERVYAAGLEHAEYIHKMWVEQVEKTQ